MTPLQVVLVISNTDGQMIAKIVIPADQNQGFIIAPLLDGVGTGFTIYIDKKGRVV